MLPPDTPASPSPTTHTQVNTERMCNLQSLETDLKAQIQSLGTDLTLAGKEADRDMVRAFGPVRFHVGLGLGPCLLDGRSIDRSVRGRPYRPPNTDIHGTHTHSGSSATRSFRRSCWRPRSCSAAGWASSCR